MRLVNHGDLLYNFIQKIILCKKVQIVLLWVIRIILQEGLVMMENNAGISKKPVVKVHVILLVAGILVLSAVLAILVAYQAGLIYGDFSELARVNGEPVYVKEYKMKLLSNTTEVINYFSQSYAVETKEISAPTATVAKRRLKWQEKGIGRHCGVKVQQILAKEKGIIESTDYREFLKELEMKTDKERMHSKATR